MARIRSIKPETFTDELIGSLSRDVQLLYIGLWTLCDDDGRFRANAALVRSSLFAYDEALTPLEVGAWLHTLAEKGRILLYEVAGQQYGAVIRWQQHQKIDHPSPSRLPPPPKPKIAKPASLWRKSSRDSREASANVRETLATDRDRDRDRDQGPGSGEDQVLVAARPGTSPPPGSSPETPSGYVAFVGAFDRYFREANAGAKPTWGSKQGALVKSILAKHGLDECLRRAKRMFRSPPSWLTKGGGSLTLTTLVSNFDAFAGDVPVTASKPPVVNQAFRDLAARAGVDFSQPEVMSVDSEAMTARAFAPPEEG